MGAAIAVVAPMLMGGGGLMGGLMGGMGGSGILSQILAGILVAPAALAAPKALARRCRALPRPTC